MRLANDLVASAHPGGAIHGGLSALQTVKRGLDKKFHFRIIAPCSTTICVQGEILKGWTFLLKPLTSRGLD